MQSAFVFLVDTLFSLLFWVFLLRLLLQWTRVRARNPVTAAVMQLTDWLVLPLRRMLPPMGRVDTASLVAVFAVALVQIAALRLAAGAELPDGADWLLAAVLEVLRSTLWLYFWAIFAYALLSMIAPGIDSPLQDILEALCEPVLSRIRSAVPAIAGLDLSPMWAGIIIQVLLILLR
jgi:YggT family protein